MEIKLHNKATYLLPAITAIWQTASCFSWYEGSQMCHLQHQPKRFNYSETDSIIFDYWIGLQTKVL